MKPAPGLLLDQRYELVAPFADRGVGESWQALDKQHGDRMVSVKLLKPLPAGTLGLPRDLSDALRALRAFRHDDVPAVLNHGVWEGRPYLVNDPFEGRSIGAALDAARTEKKPLGLPLLEALFDRVCRTFEAAHSAPRQVLHLGLTPGCVLFHGDPPDLTVSVVDFGVTKHAGSDPTAPVRSARGLLFPAPEQLTPDGQTGPHTDVFSLGGLLREMLSAPPELGLTLSPAGLERRRDDVPEALWSVVGCAMATRPDDRFASVEALREAAAHAWKTPDAVKPIAPVAPAPAAAPAAAPTFSNEAEETATTEVPISAAERLAAKAALESRVHAINNPGAAFVSAPMPSITPSTQLPAIAALTPAFSAPLATTPAFSPAPPQAPAFSPAPPQAPAFTPPPRARAFTAPAPPARSFAQPETPPARTFAPEPPPAPSFDDLPDESERFGSTVAIEAVGLALPPGTAANAGSTLQPPGDDIATTQEMGNSDELLRTLAVDQEMLPTSGAAPTFETDDVLLHTMAVDQGSIEKQMAQQRPQPHAPQPQPQTRPAGPAAPLAAPLSNALPPPVKMPSLDAPRIVSTPREPAAPETPVAPENTARYRLIVAIGILFIPVLLGLFLILRSRH